MANSGFTTDSNGNSIVFCNNVDFSGQTNPSAQITTNGQLLIGHTSASPPNILAGSIVPQKTAISIGYSSPNILLNIQNSQANATSDLSKIGLASFNSADFSVDGNGFVSSTTGAGNLVLIQSQTASTSATLDFTTGITSTYSTYLFVLTNVLSSASGAGINVSISTDGGATYIASGYQHGVFTTPFNTTTLTNTNDTTRGLCGFNNEDAAPCSVSGNVFLYGITGTGNKMAFGSASTYGGTNLNQCVSQGLHTTASVVNAFRWKYNAGTIVSGTITLFGLVE